MVRLLFLSDVVLIVCASSLCAHFVHFHSLTHSLCKARLCVFRDGLSHPMLSCLLLIVCVCVCVIVVHHRELLGAFSRSSLSCVRVCGSNFMLTHSLPSHHSNRMVSHSLTHSLTHTLTLSPHPHYIWHSVYLAFFSRFVLRRLV